MIDRKVFFDEARASIFSHRLSQRQVDGMEPLLDAWDQSGFTDLRWLADVLATVRGEDGAGMYPVPEVGRGAGHPYGRPGAHGGQVPYGRGYIQTTWDSGYEKTDAGLAKHGVIKAGELLANFDLLLQPPIAAPCIIYGMAEGWYTKFKLSDYLNSSTSDFLHCRRIVNGMDRAAEFAAWAQQFNTVLIAASRKAQDTTQVVVSKLAAPAVAPPPAHPDISPDVLSSVMQGIQEALGPLTGTPLPSADTVGSAQAPTQEQEVPQQPLAPASDAASEGLSVMEAILPVLAQLFLGTSGKLGAASAVATVAPHVISGAISSIGEVPTVVGEIEALVADIQGGKWNDVPNAVEKLLGEFTKILGNFGVQLPVLNTMVAKMVQPATQANTTIATATK